MKTYCEVYLKEEIQAEALVRNLGGFSRFLQVAAADFTELVNYSNIARESQLPVKTVQGYYDILDDTLVGYRLSGWTRSQRKQLTLHPKFYWFDNGVTNALNNYWNGFQNPAYRGKLFEQWMINEVRAFLYYHQKDHQLF